MILNGNNAQKNGPEKFKLNEVTVNKYEMTSETIQFGDKTLYRIRALRDLPAVAKGQLGGYVESERNLSHEGDAWVSGDAWVFGNAQVFGNALVSGDAWVYGKASVSGDAWVFDNASVYGDARVYGKASVYGDARVFGDAKIS